jgi:hypothetical protein
MNDIDTTKYDPRAVAMVRALKLQESNDNYNAPPETAGVSLGGAYQFQQPTWKAWSKEATGKDNLPFTPENQDAVTYYKVKQWMDAGEEPEQIAHHWNPGDPIYPSKVLTKLQSIADSMPDVEQKAPATETDHGFLGNLAAGAIKPFARLGTNLIQAGEIATGNKPTTPFSGSFLGQVDPVGLGIDITKAPWEPQNRAAIADAIKNGVDIGSWFGGGAGEKEILKEGLIGFLKKASWDTAKLMGTVGGIQGASTGLEPGATPGSTVVNTITGAGAGFGSGLLLGPVQALGARSLGWLTHVPDQKAEAEATARVQEMISPKLTTREARTAMNEGRFVPGTEPTWRHPFTAGTPDSALPTQAVKDATKIIQEQIPGADKMSSPVLFDAVDNNLTKLATELKPVLEDIPVNRTTIQKITDDVANVRQTLKDNAPFTEEPNVMKRQTAFEMFLQKSKTWSMKDLWDTAIDYDKSISKAVKNANLDDPAISDSIRQQKIEWLQRRDIIKAAINDPLNGGGEISEKAFSDMKAMYNAKSGLLSNVKVNLTPEASKVGQLISSPAAKYGIGFGLGALGLKGVYDTAKHVFPELP